MFRPIQPKPVPTFYRVHINKFYKIWFSDNPSVFLGLENELRFIRMREKNKQADLYFIYSSKCLNSDAIKKLKEFCQRYNITPIDFDVDLPPMLTEKRDKALYYCAQLEISYAIQKAYGNLAGASDCTRALLPVIKKFRIYSDYDVACHFSKLNADFIEIQAPVLLNAELIPNQNGKLLLSPNSDFLAFAYDPKQPDELSPEALKALHAVQDKIIQNYATPFTLSTIYAGPKQEIGDYQDIETILKVASQNGTKQLTVFDVREIASRLPLPTGREKYFMYLKNRLQNLSVITQSGPSCYVALYSHLLPEGQRFLPLYISKDDSKWLPFLDLFQKSCLSSYPAIADCVESKNTFSNIQLHSETNPICDASWTAKGAATKKIREATMRRAANNIFSCWKTYHLLIEAKKICKPADYSLLVKKQYSLVLRKACNDLNLALVSLLLLHARRINLKINSTSSNGNTALDWAQNARGQHKDKICELLIKAGANTREERQKSSLTL